MYNNIFSASFYTVSDSLYRSSPFLLTVGSGAWLIIRTRLLNYDPPLLFSYASLYVNTMTSNQVAGLDALTFLIIRFPKPPQTSDGYAKIPHTTTQPSNFCCFFLLSSSFFFFFSSFLMSSFGYCPSCPCCFIELHACSVACH